MRKILELNTNTAFLIQNKSIVDIISFQRTIYS